MQRQLDVAAGLNTAGFVSGYRGSPLGGFDMELWANMARLKESHVVLQPGVNEDLAATAILGTQQAVLLPGAKYDGVFSIWYGKGPGVDRSGDVLKHGNRQGAAPHGGVLVAMGDDHPGKSSSVSHQSEQALAAHHIPVLFPSSVQELLEYGLAGWALSRFSGLWVGLKCVNETVEHRYRRHRPAALRVLQAADRAAAGRPDLFVFGAPLARRINPIGVAAHRPAPWIGLTSNMPRSRALGAWRKGPYWITQVVKI